jgi:3-mercaptopyruvate sulfurtransferase SseA
MDHGFKNVHALYGGFEAWQKAGNPVEPKDAAHKQGGGQAQD